MKEQYRLVSFTDMTRPPRGVEVGEKVETRAALILTAAESRQHLGLVQDLEDYLAHCDYGLTVRLARGAEATIRGSGDRFGVIRGRFSQDQNGYFLEIYCFEDLTPQLLASIPASLMKGGV